ncbi:hypothetical protein F5051DRAFT_445495 [Lentinula edodes]|nr:hypothetical protein F5051DRAFT_445495 [Lentinula edodes]
MHRPSTAHQNGGPPELGEDGDAAAKADENMTLDSSKSIALALEAERDFYEKPWKNHPSYKGKAHYCGTPFLAHPYAPHSRHSARH